MDLNQKKKFGQDLLDSRNKMDITQRDCARHCGVSIVSYQNWEHGICEPKEEKMELICKFLGLNKEDYR